VIEEKRLMADPNVALRQPDHARPGSFVAIVKEVKRLCAVLKERPDDAATKEQLGKLAFDYQVGAIVQFPEVLDAQRRYAQREPAVRKHVVLFEVLACRAELRFLLENALADVPDFDHPLRRYCDRMLRYLAAEDPPGRADHAFLFEDARRTVLEAIPSDASEAVRTRERKLANVFGRLSEGVEDPAEASTTLKELRAAALADRASFPIGSPEADMSRRIEAILLRYLGPGSVYASFVPCVGSYFATSNDSLEPPATADASEPDPSSPTLAIEGAVGRIPTFVLREDDLEREQGRVRGYVDAPDRPFKGGISRRWVGILETFARRETLNVQGKEKTRGQLRRLKERASNEGWGIDLVEEGALWTCSPLRVQSYRDRAAELTEEIEEIEREKRFGLRRD
jgi:hypothetical protein